ncbi:MAG: hypothetical protein ACLR23_25955 [Clostridia bacterium]
MKTRKKPMAAMVAALACIMALPTPAWATQPQENPKVTVNDSVVVFAGHEWWVVGDGTTGINQQPGNITLLAKEDVYGDSVFRQGHGAEFDGSQYDSENDMYYAANPDGSIWISPTEYCGELRCNRRWRLLPGDFQKKSRLPLWTESCKAAERWQRQVPMALQAEIAQKLWALSQENGKFTGNDTIRTFDRDYLLRTPYPYYSRIAAVMTRVMSVHDETGQQHFRSTPKISTYIDSAAYAELAVRPAFSLDGSKIFLTTGSSDKSAVSVGDGFIGMPAPANTMKFTILDSSQTLSVIATKEQRTRQARFFAFAITMPPLAEANSSPAFWPTKMAMSRTTPSWPAVRQLHPEPFPSL